MELDNTGRNHIDRRTYEEIKAGEAKYAPVFKWVALPLTGTNVKESKSGCERELILSHYLNDVTLPVHAYKKLVHKHQFGRVSSLA